MAYNYLSLTNDVCKAFNEVQLTESNFSSFVGAHEQIKDAVNYAIRDINQDHYMWPFNFVLQTDTLTPGQLRYSFPSNYKTSDNQTFRIPKNDSLNNETRVLSEIRYADYLNNYVDQEYDTTNEGIRKQPYHIAKTRDLGYVVAPSPDKAYELIYEYYSLPTDLVDPTDVPTIPEQFRPVIVEGATYYTYKFRSDLENAQMTLKDFKDSLSRMRGLYINDYVIARSTMIVRNKYKLPILRKDDL